MPPERSWFHCPLTSTTVRSRLIGLLCVLALVSTPPRVWSGDRTAPKPPLSAIGKSIFFDSTLSADGQIACASCHRPELAFTDGRPVAIGIQGYPGTRNTPSLREIANRQSYFWDGRRVRLTEAVLPAFFDPREHGLTDQNALLTRIRGNALHASELASHFAVTPGDIRIEHVATALAAYLETLDSKDSPFDRHRSNPEKNALIPAAVRGLELFSGRAHCATCHRIEGVRARFTDDDYHSAGVGLAPLQDHLPSLVKRAVSMTTFQIEASLTQSNELAALGRFLVSGDPRDIGKFRTPSLRNVARTAPYMHDGSLPTLEAVLTQEIYYRSLADGEPIVLTAAERDDLIAFLHSLTEDD